MNRRRFLFCALASATTLPLVGGASTIRRTKIVESTLRPGPARTRILPAGYPDTAVWAFNGSVPGPTLRARQGDRLRVSVENALEESTTVHWHGVRLPNSMDGVPLLTQAPIAPGGKFVYEFDVPDAGTFFYHPHQRSFEQVARGLAGALIIEERVPPVVDREVTWMLGDWRVNQEGAIAGGFGSFMDASHAGRIGNAVTINGKVPGPFPVRAGERIRLRLIAAATARAFALDFENHRPWVIALDGQPVSPHQLEPGRLQLGPGMRADLILDMTAAPGTRHDVHDRFFPRGNYRLSTLEYSDELPLRVAFEPVPSLPPNPLAEPDLERAEQLDLRFAGGMMGDLRGLPRGAAWSVNGAAAGCGESGVPLEPLFVLRRGQSYRVNLTNDTAWHHPIHLHGHSFRLQSRNGSPVEARPWMDTVLLAPRERAEIALVADNPGDWMLHCHVLEHQATGMAACIRVL